MNGKIATGLLGLIVAVSVAGCSNDPSTEEASSTTVAATTTAASTTVSPTPTTDAPAPADSAPAEAPEAPPAADPAAPSDATSGVTGEALYQQTCTQFMPSIDALEQTGISDRAKSVEGLRTEMTTAPSWNTVPPSDQEQILRGLDAAGAGQC
ncbi:hypothetical protein CH275_12115 [Rhodococcus sp. 06-235-1A]|uniref:hypothetical protein n=1 Tax=Rhodococcus sp. 06-235-1A TaxID=2022508 RepID=UPI000B9BBECD|nr:hypothetical protein [Rhodococcus sp. 06-235-1A]OZD05109.1 hypothetical protein CH275_12115 [Rhodococcus sp. 06-235-1A]